MLRVKIFQINSERRVNDIGERSTNLVQKSEKILGDFLKGIDPKDVLHVVQTVENSGMSHGGMALFTIIYDDKNAVEKPATAALTPSKGGK